MSDDRRRLLTPFAPWLLGTTTEDPRTWPAITEVCAGAALALASQPNESRLLADLHAARDWMAEASRPERSRAPWADRRKRRWARHAVRTALLTVAACADRDDADATLCQMLADCVNTCRELAGEPAVDPLLPLADCPQRMEVEPHFLRSPGCDWIETGYRPVGPLPPESPHPPQVHPIRGETESATGTPNGLLEI
jgi:hypothetical protein